MWGSTALSHVRLLRLLDGIPAHRRPRSPEEFEPVLPLLIAVNLLADDAADLRRLGGNAFRQGLEAVCTPLHARFAPLGPALADCQDFIGAAALAAQGLPRPAGMTPQRLQLAWVETRGFGSLLAASRRWHQRPADPPDRDQAQRDRTRIGAILGEHREGEALGRELCTAADLAEEGRAMHHCVAQYWTQCCDLGTRIFALGAGTDRATAEYRFAPGEARFSLAQLRGPHNALASHPLTAFARAIEARLNALDPGPGACRPGPFPGRP